MKKKTLVIHPTDPSTDFLTVIYKGRGFTEIHEDFEATRLQSAIEEHDRILLLGHGYPNGLLNYYETIIDESFVPVLRGKELVGIWCYAKAFFERHQLPGFHTDMFISEIDEAMIMGVEATEKAIDVSNYTFSKLVRKYLFHPQMYERIMQGYKYIRTPVALFNWDRLYFRDESGVLHGNANPPAPNAMAEFIGQGLEEVSKMIRDNPNLFTHFLPKL